MEAIMIAVFLLLGSTATEVLAERFIIPWLDGLKGKWGETNRVTLILWITGLVGVFMAWELDLQMFAAMGRPMRHSIAEWIVTGLLLGLGSNFFHAQFVKPFILGDLAKQLQEEEA